MNSGFERQLELLCRISAEEHSLQSLVNAAGELFDNPVHVTDMSRTVLVHTNSLSIENEHWCRSVVHAEGIQETPQQVQEVRRIHSESIRSRQPMYVDDDIVPFPRIIKTLLNDTGHPIGVVILSGINHPLTPVDGHLLELLSVHLVRQMEREHFVLRANDRQAENFLIKLLDGTVDSEKQVNTWLNYLNWHPKPARYVLVLQEDSSDIAPEPVENVLDALRQLPHSRAVIYDSRIVLVFTRTTPVGVWQEEQALLEQVRRWHMVMGISREIPRLCGLREAYLEARTALRLGCGMGAAETAYEYARYAFYHLLESLPKGINLRRFCHDKVLRLEQADKSPDKELMTTLLNYLNNARSLTKTAEEMYIHRNTVRNRINKCMEIMQTELESGDEIFDILCSLRILKILRLFE